MLEQEKEQLHEEIKQKDEEVKFIQKKRDIAVKMYDTLHLNELNTATGEYKKLDKEN